MVDIQVFREILKHVGVELLAVVGDNKGLNAKFAHVGVLQRRDNRSRAFIRQRGCYQKPGISISLGKNVPEH